MTAEYVLSLIPYAPVSALLREDGSVRLKIVRTDRMRSSNVAILYGISTRLRSLGHESMRSGDDDLIVYPKEAPCTPRS